MSSTPTPTFEQMMALFLETREQMKETDRKLDRMIEKADKRREEVDRRFQETDRQMKRTDKKIDALGSRIGEIVENMVSGNGNIVDKFQTFGYEITEWNPRKKFINKK